MIKNEINELFNDISKVKFGCVLFDLQDTDDGKSIPLPGSGWASIEGSPAFRIKSVSELSSDIKWITNLTQDILWKTGAVKQAKLKHSAYLRTEISQMMKELGLIPPKTPIAEVCEAISEIFTKTMKLAVEFYNLNSFEQKDLSSEIRLAVLENDGNISSYVDEALSRSYQDLVICEKNIQVDSNNFLITLKRPRYYHCKSILETSIPLWEGDWEFFGPDELPSNSEEKINFLMEKEVPFVAKLKINSYNYNYNLDIPIDKLLNLGEALGEGGKTKERNWVCQPELLYLRKFADLEIDAAFIAKGYTSAENLINIPYLGELSDFSYSVGLLSESLWVGLASRSINPVTRSKTLVSPRACWLKSADRFMTLTSAMMMASAGFKVVSYGFGGVTVLINEKNINGLIELAPHAGLCVPVSVIDKNFSSLFF